MIGRFAKDLSSQVLEEISSIKPFNRFDAILIGDARTELAVRDVEDGVDSEWLARG